MNTESYQERRRIEQSARERYEKILVEGWKLKKGWLIVVSGESGSGKGTLVEGMEELYGVRKENFGGDTIRTQMGRTRGTIGFVDRDPEVDRKMDQAQLDFMVNYLPTDEAVVIESRLGGVILNQALEIRRKRNLPHINHSAFLVTVDWQTRAKRMQKRAFKELGKDLIVAWKKGADANFSSEWMNFLGKYALSFARENLEDLKKIKAEEKDRKIKDLALWKTLHPRALSQITDVFSPNAIGENRKQIYDFTVSSKGQVAETRLRAHDLLVSMGALERQRNTEKRGLSRIPRSATVFVSDIFRRRHHGIKTSQV